jgi:hypothetical protein
MGHASLMRPARLLPTVWFVSWPLRRGSNAAAAIIAAKIARGHGTSTSGRMSPHGNALGGPASFPTLFSTASGVFGLVAGPSSVPVFRVH